MFMTTLRCKRRSNMAAAIMGSSLKTFPHEYGSGTRLLEVIGPASSSFSA